MDAIIKPLAAVLLAGVVLTGVAVAMPSVRPHDSNAQSAIPKPMTVVCKSSNGSRSSCKSWCDNYDATEEGQRWLRQTGLKCWQRNCTSCSAP